ncbi:MAG TPA: Flp family type IVb pilin [Allosphingosinicella sp.]|nr:Flp family type IVb pilin [Allosphingosinicella sp.]
MRYIRLILSNCRAATAIEYALVASLIAVAAIVAMQSLGQNMNNTFVTVNQSVAGS